MSTFHRKDAKNAEFFLLFSFERKENNNHKPCGNITTFWEHLHLITRCAFYKHQGVFLFLFCPLSRKEKNSPLRTLRLANLPGADKAGGD